MKKIIKDTYHSSFSEVCESREIYTYVYNLNVTIEKIICLHLYIYL